MTNTTNSAASHETTISRGGWGRLVLAFAAGAVVAGGLAAAAPSGADGAPSPQPAAVAHSSSGTYGVSRDQWAYFVGYEAGRGAPLAIDSAFVLSDAELSFLRHDFTRPGQP